MLSAIIQQLVEDFGRYLYLPRLRNSDVLLNAIRNGLGLLTWEKDSFAYADSFDEIADRYCGLRHGAVMPIMPHDTGLLVRPDIVREQIIREAKPEAPMPAAADNRSTQGVTPTSPTKESTIKGPTRYHGAVVVDPSRVGRDAGRIAEEVISHLVVLVGANVTITIEIEAAIPNGTPDNIVRTVTENGRTLKFQGQQWVRRELKHNGASQIGALYLASRAHRRKERPSGVACISEPALVQNGSQGFGDYGRPFARRRRYSGPTLVTLHAQLLCSTTVKRGHQNGLFW